MNYVIHGFNMFLLLILQEERRSQGEDVVESLLRTQAPEVEDEEAIKEPTPTGHSTFGRNPISTNKLQSSLAETERARTLFELAFDNPALDTPKLLWKVLKSLHVAKVRYKILFMQFSLISLVSAYMLSYLFETLKV